MVRFWIALGLVLSVVSVYLSIRFRETDKKVEIIRSERSSKTSRMKEVVHKVRPTSGNKLSVKGKSNHTSAGLMRFMIQSALDRHDARSVCKLAEKVASSEDALLREEAVTALGWFGADVIPEMLAFINDPSPKVASKAFEYVDLALDMIEDNAMKVRLIELTLSYAMSEDEARSVLSKLESVKDYQAVRSLADLSERASMNPELLELVKEEFKDITGGVFVSAQHARYWADKHISD